MINEMLDKLNPMQKQAVLTTEGPLLLLAGAGSGKTRVLTHRIAYLIEQGVRPFNILAITFTNKAAREMKERVSAISPQGDEVWVSTFHSTCVRLLRREIDKIGYSNQFSIYDSDDTERMLKAILKDFNISDKVYPVKGLMSEIGSQKDNLIGPEQYAINVSNDFRLKKVSEIYTEYQKRLTANNALDFDDLIFKTVELFKTRPDILEKYQDRFRYIMVDEYQDTNTSQYQLIRLLSAKYHNLCVVGDDDQSIYGWRGANIRNILDFEKDYKNAVTIKLEQNYRSTEVILNAANEVIQNNTARKSKKLWTESLGGEPIHYYQANSDLEEARFISSEIKKGTALGGYKNYAILYRNNALSRTIEESLVKNSIPYRLFGGTRFYDRKEIRDVMSYLKAIYNPTDDIAIRRIINVPKRGIGDATVAKVAEYALQKGISFYETLCNIDNIPELKTKAKPLKAFAALFNNLCDDAEELKVSDLLDDILDNTGYVNELILEGTEEAKGRIDNITELINKAVEFETKNPDSATLASFLEDVALVSDVDGYSEDADTVVLMTLHSSKGLEFPTVFIAGFEEGIFPSYRAIVDENPNAVEEERRLCYVGITRAKERLFITGAKSRLQHGQYVSNSPSRFLKEIPAEYLDIAKNSAPDSPQQNTTRSFSAKASYTANAMKSYSMPAPKDVTIDFEVGDKVRQMKYGIGDVIAIDQAGADYEVTVQFPNIGTKKFMAKLSKLKKV